MLEKLCAQAGGKLKNHKDEMELLQHVQMNAHSICIIGQSKETPEPTYIVWLLKGMIHSSNIILVYSMLDEVEEKKLHRYGATNILTRPMDPHRLARMVESAFTAPEERTEGLMTAIIRLLPFHKHSITH